MTRILLRLMRLSKTYPRTGLKHPENLTQQEMCRNNTDVMGTTRSPDRRMAHTHYRKKAPDDTPPVKSDTIFRHKNSPRGGTSHQSSRQNFNGKKLAIWNKVPNHHAYKSSFNKRIGMALSCHQITTLRRSKFPTSHYPKNNMDNQTNPTTRTDHTKLSNL